MNRPNFFCGIDALNLLLKTEFTGEYRDIDLTMDFIELPYTFHFTSDEENWNLKAISRGELYTHDDSGITSGELSVNKATNEGQGSVSPDLNNNFGAFFDACRRLSNYIQEHGLEPVYADFDPEETGILLYVEDDQLKHKVVAGKDRPEMMCTTLFGGPVMCRPYMDDFWERSMLDEMDEEELIEAAEEGDEDAMESLAMMYLNGDEDKEVEANAEKAVYWFRKMAEAGNSNGMFNLGLHYAKGYGLERDFKQAAYWMEKAAEAGDDDAPALVEQYNSAVAALEKLDTGDAQAQADLAKVLMGLAGSLEQAGPGKDFAEAFDLAQKSAAQNNGDGLWTLALAYEHGRGVAEDTEKAVECYRKGAELGHAPSLHSLACYYMRGDVVEEDQEQGFRLMMKAAEQGYNLAVHGIGHAYQFGNGVDCDMSEAIRWYEKYLETNFDPDLARKVEFFKMMEGADMFSEMDEDADEEDVDESNLPEGYMDVLNALAAAEAEGRDPDEVLAEINAGLAEEESTEVYDGEEGSVVCLLEGDQLKCWVQKLTVIRSGIPLEDAKLLFELHNLAAGEYAKAAEDDMDVSYVGLYGLEDEAMEARRRLKGAAGVPKLEKSGDEEADDEPLSLGELLKKYPARYGRLKKYFDEDDLENRFDLEYFNFKAVEEPEKFYWIDLARVDENQYERYTSELHHVYNVAELFAPGELPFDLNDPDTVSIFGTGKFEAFADLSYGC